MRRAPRLMIIALLGLFLALPAVATVSALPAAAQTTDRLVAQPSTAPPSSGATTAPAGPKLTPDTEADQAESKRKLILGITAVVLLGIVIWGRSVRRKKQKAAGG
jgi:hypothetical protein